MKTAAIVLSLLVPSLALAAGGGDAHHDPGHTTPEQWWLMAFMFINFGLFVAMMVWFARTPLHDYLAARRKQLVEAMAEAARAKEEAERIKREYEEKLARLGDAKSELAAEIGRIAEGDRERLLADAREAAARLKKDAELTASSDFERARHELREEAARLATELASGEIRKRMDDSERGRLLKQFLGQIDRAPGAERKQ